MAKHIHTPDHLPGRVRALFFLVFASTAMLWASLPALHAPQDSSSASISTSLAPIWPVHPASVADDTLNHQKVFPYSVIPGGAQSAQELKKAVEADPVVARH